MSLPLFFARLRWIALCLSIAALCMTFEVAAKQEGRRGPPLPRTKESELIRQGTDLLISNIRLTEKGFVEYEVKNRGRTSAGNFVAEVYVGTVRRDTISHARLRAGETYIKASHLAKVEDFCKGGHVRVVIDSQDIVREYNEENNARKAFLRKRCPDLAIREIRIERIGPDPSHPLRPTYAVAEIVNQGDENAPSAKDEMFAGRKGFKLKKTRVKMIRALRPREVDRISSGIAKTRRKSRKNWAVRVIVDVGNQIPESNEKNNDVRWSN